MKKLITLIVAPLLITLFAFTSCRPNDERDENGQEYPEMMTENEREQMEEDKAELRKDLEENQKKINEIREDLKDAKDEVKEAYNQRLIELENQNEALRIRLIEFGEKTQREWNEFKMEFKKDMRNFGEEIRDFNRNANDEKEG